jgi:hypothetical protein
MHVIDASAIEAAVAKPDATKITLRYRANFGRDPSFIANSSGRSV